MILLHFLRKGLPELLFVPGETRLRGAALAPVASELKSQAFKQHDIPSA